VVFFRVVFVPSDFFNSLLNIPRFSSAILRPLAFHVERFHPPQTLQANPSAGSQSFPLEFLKYRQIELCRLPLPEGVDKNNVQAFNGARLKRLNSLGFVWKA